MLRYAAIFFILTLIAFVFTLFGNVLIGATMLIAKIFFFVFLALFLGSLVMEYMHRRKK